jgi:hypothetical protein
VCASPSFFCRPVMSTQSAPAVAVAPAALPTSSNVLPPPAKPDHQKGSIVGRGTPFREGLLGLACGMVRVMAGRGKDCGLLLHPRAQAVSISRGFLPMRPVQVYGATGPLVTHPLDTVITRMQTASVSQQRSATQTARQIVAEGGIRSLYRGLPFPLLGSTLFRSTQFAVYNSAFVALDGTAAAQEIPGSSGLQSRVILAGLASSFARALIENPFEVMKVRRQTGQDWRVGPNLRDVFSLKQVWEGRGSVCVPCVCVCTPV